MSENFNCLRETAIILPSLNPDHKFEKVVNGLLTAGFQHIVIVDDGSRPEEQHFFDTAEKQGCAVLHHEVNKGKGRALKTAFHYVLDNLPDLKGVITIDGDGQHLTHDIIACGEKMLANPADVVLGCRNFDLPDVPQKSYTGNKTTAMMFRICYGIKISDTQTGLRAIPQSCLERFCRIEGERFEYETNMLLYMKKWGIRFLEQPIDTVYEDNNSGTHYHPVRDSWRIFKVMFKFLMSSLGSTLIDLLLYYLMMRFAGPGLGGMATLVSTVVARAVSSFFNFNANNKVVFGNEGSYSRALLRYYCLCIPQMLISAGLVTLVNHLLSVTAPGLATVVKFCIDTFLFFISYQIQREWVFSSKK